MTTEQTPAARTLVIFMTAHNTATYIAAAVASARASMALAPSHWRVSLRIGVDGCAATAAVLDDLGEPYYWSPENVGSFRLRNSLVTMAPADAYAGFDSDDVMLPDYVPALIRLLDSGVAMAGVARFEVRESLHQYEPPRVKLWRALGGSCVVTHDAWTTLGGYWDGYRGAMDTELMDRARKAGLRWAAEDTPLFLRRCNPTSLTQSPATNRRSPMRQAAIDALAARAQDATLIHLHPSTAPLTFRDHLVRVAVVVTAYRADPSWLLECVASIRASAARLPAWVSIDLRIGVDGCAATAGCLDAAREPYYWSQENVGTYRLRNSLVAQAPADAYIMFDADDVMLKPCLPTMIKALRTCPLVGPSRYDVDPRLKGPILMKYVSGVCGMTHATWQHLGGYRDERYSADTDLIARTEMATPPVPLHIEREPLYLRRRHAASLTNAPGTGYSSRARKDAQARMQAQRAAGQWQNVPVTTPLIYVKAQPTQETAAS